MAGTSDSVQQNLVQPIAVPTAAPRHRLYAPVRPAARASWFARLVAAAVAVGCLSLLVTAAGLAPSPSGVGSHRDLGLQSCGLLAKTGLPCPSCGMTTSFAWFVRGNLPASFYVQPMGMVLALSAACCVWGGAYVALTGRPAHRLLFAVSGRSFLMAVLGFGVAAWGWKIFLQLQGLDGWR